MTKTGLEFGILVIVICLIFGICDLEFLVTLAAATTGIFYSFANTKRYRSKITPMLMAESATLKAGQW